jgi:hypothetical protein
LVSFLVFRNERFFIIGADISGFHPGFRPKSPVNQFENKVPSLKSLDDFVPRQPDFLESGSNRFRIPELLRNFSQVLLRLLTGHFAIRGLRCLLQEQYLVDQAVANALAGFVIRCSLRDFPVEELFETVFRFDVAFRDGPVVNRSDDAVEGRPLGDSSPKKESSERDQRRKSS